MTDMNTETTETIEPRLMLGLTRAEVQIHWAALDIAIKATGGSNPQATMAFASQVARLQAEAQAVFGAPQT